jgi:hypothetical protein
MNCVTPAQRWLGVTVVVAAPGPSLTPEAADRVKGFPTIVVNDAWRLLPRADVLFACDAAWWRYYRGVPGFEGERWSSHGTGNDKQDVALAYGINCVRGRHGTVFSRKQGLLHYGSNSGFQAINLAIQFGAAKIVLIGFDMRVVDGQAHFFGNHPKGLRNADPRRFVTFFVQAAKQLKDVEIVNATPRSALTCWPIVTIEDALCPSKAAA